MDELQAGVELALAVLPQAPVLLQPSKAALHHPSLGDHRKFVQLAALGNLHCDVLAQDLLHTLCKGLPHVATVAQQALEWGQTCLAAAYSLQGTLAIRHLGCAHLNGMGQALCIHCNVAFDARDLLARVLALQARRVCVFHALRVHDQ